MSKYTTEVRFICEDESGLKESVGFSRIDEVLSGSWNKIFTSAVEFFMEDYREFLCKKILKHYYTREIGAETVGLWKLWVNTKLEEIMPYYNQMYRSALLEIKPLENVNYTRIGNRNENGRSKKNGQDVVVYNSAEHNLYSDTPQGGVEGLESGNYLTSATKNDLEYSNTTSYDSGDTNENSSEYDETISGKISGVSDSKLLMEYRETFINIDMLVIKEFEDCFMSLW